MKHGLAPLLANQTQQDDMFDDVKGRVQCPKQRLRSGRALDIGQTSTPPRRRCQCGCFAPSDTSVSSSSTPTFVFSSCIKLPFVNGDGRRDMRMRTHYHSTTHIAYSVSSLLRVACEPNELSSYCRSCLKCGYQTNRCSKRIISICCYGDRSV